MYNNIRRRSFILFLFSEKDQHPSTNCRKLGDGKMENKTNNMRSRANTRWQTTPDRKIKYNKS